jgi:hypothetical protein
MAASRFCGLNSKHTGHYWQKYDSATGTTKNYYCNGKR